MRRLLLAALILLCSVLSGVAQQIDLHGLHAVTVDADDPSFADPGFDDSGWARIQVPSSLRAAGIDGRPDVFWYRIAFDLPADWSGSSPAIRLGVITRSDETYLNGVRIGGLGHVGGRLSDWHVYAPTMPRLYAFDAKLLRPGAKNVLVVRGAREPYIDDGGIIVGPVGLVELPEALGEFLPLLNRFVSFRYLFFGIETMIVLGMLTAICLGVRSRFLLLFGLFYIPSYLFSLERRGIAETFGVDGPATQFFANACGALALPALIEFVAHVLDRKVHRVGRAIQVLSVLTLISIPNTDVQALQWWSIESHLVWHLLMLVGLLAISAWTIGAALRRAAYSRPLSIGLLVLFAGVAVDIVSPVNILEREFGFRIGECGILLFYLSLAFVVIQNIADREASLLTANAHITRVHEEERTRMARDLHDGIGQWLTAIKIKLDLLPEAASGTSDGDSARLEALSEDVAAAIEDVRRVAHDLAPALLEERGLVGAIHAHAERACGEGQVDIIVDAPSGFRLEPVPATHVFRIFQEALSNALRHSGCDRVDISLVQTRRHSRLRVSDNGCGFDDARPQDRFTLGIASMRSRAELLGGTLGIRSGGDEGTTLTLLVPRGRKEEDGR